MLLKHKNTVHLFPEKRFIDMLPQKKNKVAKLLEIA